MSPGYEIDYEALIDRTITDFQPARQLRPIGARLFCWMLVEAAILGLDVWMRGSVGSAAIAHNPHLLLASTLFIFASIAAAFIALSSAIPGRDVSWVQLSLSIALVCAGFAVAFEPLSRIPSSDSLDGGAATILQIVIFAALPWLVLFWAVRRGVPVQPRKTGVAVGLAAFCFALTAHLFISQPEGTPAGLAYSAFPIVPIIVFSGLAGASWLDWIARWQREPVADEAPERWALLKAQTIFPIALSVSTAALLLFLKGPGLFLHISDFDLAIDNYQQALNGFRPNVPSASMEMMLTAYVEHGMPAYMWDFGPQGFKLVGGRWSPLPDGTAVTYTWFRGEKGGVMCVFKQIDAFNPPPIGHDEYHHLLFYRYRGFSFCLINVGGYGDFISVIAAPMPLKRFEHLVIATTL
jgi:hypothetical protein